MRPITAVGVGILVATTQCATSPPCDLAVWNTWGFFEEATVEEVTACLAAGADLNSTNEYGYTPLHEAVKAELAVVEMLLAAGADPNVRAAHSMGGMTPLYAAVEGSTMAVVEALLEAGADPNARCAVPGAWQFVSPDATADVPGVRHWGGPTPLHKAAGYHENPGVIMALVAAGADVNAREGEAGDTPLHWAASNNENPAVIEALLEAGANPHAQDQNGDTPLDRANDSLPVIKVLLTATRGGR